MSIRMGVELWTNQEDSRTHVVRLRVGILTQRAANLSHGLHPNDPLQREIRDVVVHFVVRGRSAAG